MPGNRKIRIIVLEDNPADADLLAEQLADEKMSFEYRRVDSEREFARELEAFEPDLVLADYRLPGFDGLAALRLARAKRPFIPFILVSGVLDEEAAVELFRAGATDYLRKGMTVRLGTAVRNALKFKTAQEEKARAEEELRKSNQELERRVEERTRQLGQLNEALHRERELLQTIFDFIPVMLSVYDPALQTVHVNKSYEQITGWSRGASLQDMMAEAYPDPEYRAKVFRFMQSLDRGWRDFTVMARDGTPIESSWANIQLPDGRRVGIGVDIRERKKAEEEIARSRQWLERVAATTPNIIYIVNIENNRLVYANRNLFLTLGYNIDELRQSGDVLRRLVYPEDLPQAAEYFRGLADAKSGEVKTWTNRVLHHDGGICWLENNVSPFTLDARGRVVEVIGVARDVTGRKKAEEELRRREEEFRTLTENAPVGIIRINAEGTYLYVNREAEHIMQHPREGIVGKSVGMFGMPPEAQTVFRKNILLALDTRSLVGMEFSVPRKERTYYYQVRFVPEAAEGKPGTVLAIQADITDLKEAEARIKQANATAEKRALEAEEGQRTLATLMDNIPEGILIAEPPRGRIRLASRYISDITGVSLEEILGLENSEVRERLRMETVGAGTGTRETPLVRAVQSGEVTTDEEWAIRPAGRAPVVVLINARPICDPAGAIVGAVSSWRDITERKKSEDLLRRNEYELRTLVDNSPDLIFRFNRLMQYEYANPAYERLTGRTKEQLAGKTNSDLGMPGQLAEFWQSAVREALESGREHSTEFGMASLFGNRYFFARLIPEFAKSGMVETVLVIAQDITERKRAEERIRYISFHDEVTCLFNRAFFEEELRRVDTERSLPVSIIMGDVNNLKLTNDVFGHDEGDRLLKAIAAALRKACRQSDIVARWGGDEFVAILPATDAATAGEIAARISRIAGEDRGTVLRPSIAVGTATKCQRDQNIYQVIRESEERMYEDKLARSGGNREAVMSRMFELAGERREDYGGHVRRIRELVDRFGGELGLPEDQINDLRMLAELHDIGDAAIPRELLAKPGPLDSEEWAIMKKHSEAGFRIVKTYAETARISDEVLAHGESWDGSGYPRGLKGAEIPYLARVFLIIDAFDAMTHRRPYARTFTREEAIEQLRRGAGRQFDRELTDRFIVMLKTEEPVQVLGSV